MSDLTVAVSEGTFKELFAELRKNFSFSKSDSRDFGRFTASYAAALHLEGGSVDLRSDGTVQIKELDVKWDTLSVSLGLDIPEITVGGFCIIKNPFTGACLVKAPKISIFSADPDITVPLNLSGLVRSEISATASLKTKYFVHPNRTGAMSDLDAKDQGIPNKWQLFLDPATIDLDVIDIADTVGDLLESLVNRAIDGLLGGLPDWAKNVIRAIMGPVIDLIRDILDVPDDIGEWISNLLGVSFGLFNLIVAHVLRELSSQKPIYQLEDPYPVMSAESGLIPVMIPVRDLAVGITDREMTINANVG